MDEKQGLTQPTQPNIPNYPQTAPPPYQPGYGSTPGMPSYTGQQQGYPTPYGMGHQPIMTQPTYGCPPIAQIPDHMTMSILVTILCCWPIGLFAIIKSQESRRCLQMGDTPSALYYANLAKRYIIAAAVSGGVVLIILVVTLVIMTL